MDTAYIIDDHLDTSHMLEMLLQSEGYCTQCCASYSEALDKLRHNAPCILYVDLNVPDKIETDEFIKQARQAHPGVRVVIVSGGTDIERRAKQLGADGFLNKPFEMDVLLKTTAMFCPKPAKKTG